MGVLFWGADFGFLFWGFDFGVLILGFYFGVLFCDADGGLTVPRAVEHPGIPEDPEYVRVRSYESHMVIRPHRSFDEVGKPQNPQNPETGGGSGGGTGKRGWKTKKLGEKN